MAAAFHEILGSLRRGRGLSQRKAAADLQISQALLSHYENGIREPGLPFVRRACAYYDVSADFLLGCKGGRGGGEPALEALSTAAGEGGAALLERSLSILLQLTQLAGGDRLSQEAASYIGAASYRLFRHLLGLVPDRETTLLASDSRADGLSEIEMRLSEMRFLAALADGEGTGSDADLPRLCRDLETVLAPMDRRIAAHMPEPHI